MRFKRINGLINPVSALSFGAWGIGGRTPGATSYGETNDAVSVLALETAVESGVNFFDTSNVYGAGHSERLLGQVLNPVRNSVSIATKVGHATYDSPYDFSASGMARSLEDSLERLKTGYVDVLQLHSPPKGWIHNYPEILEVLKTFKRDGLVRALGVSVSSPQEALDLAGITDISLIQSNFNMMDIRAIQSGLLKRLEANGQHLVARTPLCFGFLSGRITEDTVFPEGDHRNSWPTEQRSIWIGGSVKLKQIGGDFGIASLPEMALRFCASFPSVVTVLAGCLNEDEVRENTNAINLGPLSAEILQKVIDLHNDQTFFQPSDKNVNDQKSQLLRH